MEGRVPPVTEDELEDSPLRQALKAVSGPSETEMANGRRLLLTRVASKRATAGAGRSRRGLRAGGLLAGVAAFGLVAMAAGAAGLPSAGSLENLLTELNVVPSQATDHVDSAPRQGPPDPLPVSDAAFNNTLAPVVPEDQFDNPTDADAHGAGVATSVQEALGAEPGPAVGQAACAAGQDRTNLPPQAQGHGPEDAQACGAGTGGPSLNLGPTTPEIGQSNAPVNVPPASPPGNPVGAPPSDPGSGTPPVAAPPSEPPPNPVGAPPSEPGLGAIPDDAGAPTPPTIPDEAVPPVTPGEPGTPTDLPPDPPAGKPDGTPGGRP
jgi:hypothetical protein